jgi:hypothetical protein
MKLIPSTKLCCGNTRFLSLFPGIVKQIEMHEPLKVCFIRKPKIPTLILNFIQNESNRLWLLFLHSELDTFTKKILSRVRD